nr:GntR family transcriptional regulator [Acidaminobacter sp. JC074]
MTKTVLDNIIQLLKCTILTNTVGSGNVIQLNEKSKIPIYQQVYDGLLDLIVLKVLDEEEKLPSVRELALMLEINPNTIQKAYKALEADGYILSVKGKGNFVARYQEIISVYENSTVEKLRQVLKELMVMGLTKDEILKHVTSALEGLE